jgi:uncharacterized membrane protein YjjB (DUF3815 family)
LHSKIGVIVMLARVRKAVTAGLGAGFAAGFGVLFEAGAPNRDQVSKAIGAFVVAAAVVGWATWRVPNKPAYKVGGVVKP